MSKDTPPSSSQTTKLIKLKGFKIQHKIGSGSFSTVYKATTDVSTEEVTVVHQLSKILLSTIIRFKAAS